MKSHWMFDLHAYISNHYQYDKIILYIFRIWANAAPTSNQVWTSVKFWYKAPTLDTIRDEIH